MENPAQIQSLIAELQSNQLQNQANAAKALSSAAFNNVPAQNAIREANGLSVLLDLAVHPDTANELREEALWALWVVIQNNAGNKQALRNLDAISRLEALPLRNDPILSGFMGSLLTELQNAQVFHYAQSRQGNVGPSQNQP